MSGKKCCVPLCPFLDATARSDRILHGFPNPQTDTERFNKWVLSIGGDIIGLENHYIYKCRRVCHVHFEEKYCCRNNRITCNSVPTLYLPGFQPGKWRQSLGNCKEASLPGTAASASNTSEPSTSSSGQPHGLPLLDHDYCWHSEKVLKSSTRKAANDTEKVSCGESYEDHFDYEAAQDEDNIATENSETSHDEVLQFGVEESQPQDCVDPLCLEPEQEEPKPDIDELNQILDQIHAENMSKVSSVEDLEKCCHLCLSQDCTLTPLVGSGLEEMLMDLFSLEAAEGNWPALACGDCAARVSSAHGLQRLVRASHNHIMQLLQVKMDSTVQDDVEQCFMIETETPFAKPVTTEITVQKEDVRDSPRIEQPDKKNIATENIETNIQELTEDQMQVDHFPDSLQESDRISDDEGSLPDLPFVFDRSRQKNVCYLCKESFNTAYLLKKHKLDVHGAEEAYVCRFCGKVVKTAIYKHERLHMKPKTKPKYKCEMCGGEFTVEAFWKRHIRRMHNGQQLPVCHHCARAFDTREMYYRHLKEEHGDMTPYRCSLCPRVYRDMNLLNLHMKRHYKGAIRTEKTSVEYTDTETSLAVAQIIAAVSQDMDPDSQNNDTAHEEKYKCEMCGAEFVLKPFWKRHIKTKHNGQRLPVCRHCVLAFETRELYFDHLKREHGDKTPYRCTLCPRVFKAMDVLDRHLKLHFRCVIKSIEAPAEPADTETSLAVAQIIAAVSQDIDDDTQNKAVKKKKNNDTAHDANGYKCEMCGDEFVLQRSWKLHITRMHNGQRLPACGDCSRTFGTRYLYFKHLKKVHGDKTPYRCSLCPKAFKGRAAFGRHMQRHYNRKSKINQVAQVASTDTQTSVAAAEDILAVPRNIEADSQNKSVSQNNGPLKLASPAGVAVVKLYHCTRCKKSFISCYAFNRHKLRCRTMECEVCESKFEELKSLLHHYKSEHGFTAVENTGVTRETPASHAAAVSRATGSKTLIQIQPEQLPKHILQKVKKLTKLQDSHLSDRSSEELASTWPQPEGEVASWYRNQAQELMKDF